MSENRYDGEDVEKKRTRVASNRPIDQRIKTIEDNIEQIEQREKRTEDGIE